MLLFIATVTCFSGAFEIPYSTPKKCKPKQYFQFSSLSCKDCGSGQKQSKDGLSCVCKVGHIQSDVSGGNIECVKCTSVGVFNSTSSLDGSFCVECPSNVGFNIGTGDCQSCPEGSIPVDRHQNGSRREMRLCVRCTGDTSPALIGNVCKHCHPSFLNTSRSCLCPTDSKAVIGGLCLEKTSVIKENNQDMYAVRYDEKTVISYFFKENLRAAQVECDKDSNLTACQLLGNLCVLLDYNLDAADGKGTNTDACKEYLKIVKKKTKEGTVHTIDDWAPTLPWLYYRESVKDAVDILDSRDVGTKFAANEKMTFVLAIYTLNGTFVGLQNGTEVFQMCQDRPSKLEAAARFGTTYRLSCSVTVEDLMKMPMFFYDMFIIANDGQLFPIPVLDENFKVKSKFVNREGDRTKWQLTRRFVTVDNLVGKPQGDLNLRQLRYAKDIELSIKLRSSDGEIYPPLLRIRYDFVDVTDEDTDFSKSTKTVSFTVSYEMDTEDIRKDTMVSEVKPNSIHRIKVRNKPVLQSCAVAESDNL